MPDDEQGEIDPEDFLRALLRISPEDAAKAREDAARRDTAQRPPSSEDEEGRG